MCTFAHISETTGASDFKFGPGVAKLPYLVMVVLTQKSFPAHYAWFPHGRSHMGVPLNTRNLLEGYPILYR